MYTGIFFGHLSVNPIHSESLVVFPIGQKCSSVDHVDLTGLESLKAGCRVRDILDNDFIPIRCFSPVVLIADKSGVLTSHILVIDVRACACHAGNRLEITGDNVLRCAHGIYIRPAKILKIGIERMVIMERNGIIINDFNLLNIRNALQTVKGRVRLLMFQIGLDRLRIERFSIVESNALAQVESKLCLVIVILPAFCQSGDNLTIVKVHQVFIHQFGGAIERIIHIKGGEVCGFCSNGIGQHFLFRVCRS